MSEATASHISDSSHVELRFQVFGVTLTFHCEARLTLSMHRTTTGFALLLQGKIYSPVALGEFHTLGRKLA